ncbi:MurR/RpiR family transcriptional regulator [Chitiniphilus eburneus]|uniref:MurR/RpiR family transcriptional regulator n=1 Tax=Chitiniphilus eburneus TaxID=2571148 RepID=A0A4U0PM46_9NEIS|nr:MurR/RpiR family transcriptional regulator [Chitiniphilus eburneus]TJZ68362.1 MurR/RpiR family transcriptional regulator [Chitiniphilus eburneus]
MPHHIDIVYHIRASRERLSATERKVADAILDDLAFAASASIDQLAGKAGVSIATISRFARAVQCADVRDLKLKLAQASAVGTRFLADAAPPDESSFYARICGEIETTLRRNLALLREAQFQQAAALLADARMTYVFGMGGASTMLAQELQFRVVRLGYPVSAYHDAVLMKLVAATLDERDVVVMLSLSGATPEMLAVAALVRQYGVRLVALTDPESPLAAQADVVLPLKTDETEFIYKPSAARYAMLMAMDILATELALIDKDRSKELLRRAKFALDAHRDGHDRLPLGD